MNRIWVWMMFLMMTMLFAACGSVNIDTIHPMVQATEVGQKKKIVILPFADHTPADSPVAYWKRNMVIMESLQDEILRFGYIPAINEDVISYLSEKNIIPQRTVSMKTSSANMVLESELGKDWSETMKQEIAKVLIQNIARQSHQTASQDLLSQSNSIALNHQTIQDIGTKFNADYILRGRIMLYDKGQEDSFNPLQTGLLPFFFNVGSRTLFGVAQSDTYELIDKMAIGGLLGAAIAQDNWPLDDTESTLTGHPRFGGSIITEATNQNFNTAIWGLAGSGLAYLSHKGGRVDNAVVQLRMVVQDTKTGEIVWTNRAEVKTMSQSAFNKQSADVLMAQAIQQVCGRLFDNFVASDTNRRVVRVNDDGTLYVTPAGGLNAHHDPLSPIHIDSPKETEQNRQKISPCAEVIN